MSHARRRWTETVSMASEGSEQSTSYNVASLDELERMPFRAGSSERSSSVYSDNVMRSGTAGPSERSTSVYSDDGRQGNPRIRIDEFFLGMNQGNGEIVEGEDWPEEEGVKVIVGLRERLRMLVKGKGVKLQKRRRGGGSTVKLQRTAEIHAKVFGGVEWMKWIN